MSIKDRMFAFAGEMHGLRSPGSAQRLLSIHATVEHNPCRNRICDKASQTLPKAPIIHKKMPVTNWITGKFNREASRLGDVDPALGTGVPQPDLNAAMQHQTNR